MDPSSHFIYSSYREMLLEHLFIGEVMSAMWKQSLRRVEMLKSQVDNGGYDVVLAEGPITRYIQLKSAFVSARAASVKINRALADKSSGCVIWMFFDPGTLVLEHFLWFGSPPDRPFPSLDDFKIAKYVKANAQGVKSERPNIVVIPKRRFERLETIDGVIEKLFGTPVVSDQAVELTIESQEPASIESLRL